MKSHDMADILLEAIRYEHWLRFYFLDVDDAPAPDNTPDNTPDSAGPGDFPPAFLRVPEAWAARTRRDEPRFAALLDAVDGREISLEASRDSVYCHVAAAVGHNPADPAWGEALFQLVGDPDFRRGLDAFHTWVQMLAEGELTVPGQTEDDAAPFGAWQDAFRHWEKTEAVRFVNTLTPYRPE